MNKNMKTMTEGKPARLMVAFAIPLMLGNIFQQFYTLTDTLIVGRVIGLDALAALGSIAWYNYMVLSMVQALTQGFGILVAQDFGAKDLDHLKKTHAHSVRLCLIVCGIVLLLSQLTLPMVLKWIFVPETVRPLSQNYLRIIFAGLPIQVFYNYYSAVLRSLGDSKTPLYAMLLASAVNILLDLLFVVGFRWDVRGAALATVIAQACACAWVACVVGKNSLLKTGKQDFAREKGLNWRLLKLGLPMMLQMLLISVGGIVCSGVTNKLGVEFIAGRDAGAKYLAIMEIAAIAYNYAVLTYMGQNFGAGNIARIKSGYRAALLVSLVTSCILGVLFAAFARPLTGVFLTGDPARVNAAWHVAVLYLRIVCACLPLLYLLNITRAALQGIGHTFAAMISGIMEFVARMLLALVFIHWIGDLSMLLTDVASWALGDLVLCILFAVHLRKLVKKNAQQDLSTI